MAKAPGAKRGAALPAEPDEMLIEQPNDPEIIALMHAMESAGSNATARVFREGVGGYRDISFLFNCPPSEWISQGLERLQRDYGSGKYRVHLQDGNGAMVVNRAFSVEALPKKPEDAASVKPDMMTAILDRMDKQHTAMMEGFRAMQQQPANNVGIREAISLVKDLVIQPQRASGPSVQDIVTLITTGVSLARAGTPARAARDEDEHTGGSIGDRAIDRGLDLVTRLFEKHQGAQPEQQAQPQPAIQRGNIAPQPAVSETQEDEMFQMAMAKLELQRANMKAKAGASAEEYADSLYERMSDDIIITLASDANWFLYMTQLVADTAQYREWHEKVRTRIVTLAREDGLLTETAEPATVPADGTTTIAPGAATDGG